MVIYRSNSQLLGPPSQTIYLPTYAAALGELPGSALRATPSPNPFATARSGEHRWHLHFRRSTCAGTRRVGSCSRHAITVALALSAGPATQLASSERIESLCPSCSRPFFLHLGRISSRRAPVLHQPPRLLYQQGLPCALPLPALSPVSASTVSQARPPPKLIGQPLAEEPHHGPFDSPGHPRCNRCVSDDVAD
jgi:hypothetical protein